MCLPARAKVCFAVSSVSVTLSCILRPEGLAAVEDRRDKNETIIWIDIREAKRTSLE